MTTDVESRLHAVGINETDFELRRVDWTAIKLGGPGRAQKRSFVNDERSISRVEEFKKAYEGGVELPPMILEEVKGISGGCDLYMVDGNHRINGLKLLNGSAPKEVNAYVVTRALSDHERSALTVQANSKGPLPMTTSEINALILDSIEQGIKMPTIAEHYGVSRKRVEEVSRAGNADRALAALGVKERLHPDLLRLDTSTVITQVHRNKDRESAQRLGPAISLINKGRLPHSEFKRAFKAVKDAGVDPDARREQLSALDDTLKAASRPRTKPGRTGHASLQTLKSDAKRFAGREDDEFLRLARDLDGRASLETLVHKITVALEATHG